MPNLWPLYVATILLALSALGNILHPFVDAQVKADLTREPRAHFYTEEAYKNCRGMRDAAKAQGHSRWSCHRPESKSE